MRTPFFAFVCLARSDYAHDIQSAGSAAISPHFHAQNVMVAYNPMEALASTLFALHAPCELQIHHGTVSGRVSKPCFSHRNLIGGPVSGLSRSRNSAKMEEASPSTVTPPRSLTPPRYKDDMIAQAVSAVERARSDGVTRMTLRVFLPRGSGLSAPDESWEGGIMQIYSRCSPLVKDLLLKLVQSTAGVPPTLKEQRLDESGVDGESVWLAESPDPKQDAIALVQPTSERREDIRRFSGQAGPRPVLMVNPQWRMGDDPFNALSRQGGLLGMLGNAMGGQSSFQKELEELGFKDVYMLQEYTTRGSRILLLLSYPYGWSAFYLDQEKEAYVELFSGAQTRPDVRDVDQALIDNDVPFKVNEYNSIQDIV